MGIRARCSRSLRVRARRASTVVPGREEQISAGDRNSLGGHPQLASAEASQTRTLTRCRSCSRRLGEATSSVTSVKGKVSSTRPGTARISRSQRPVPDRRVLQISSSRAEPHETSSMDKTQVSTGEESCTCRHEAQDQAGPAFKIEWYEPYAQPSTSSRQDQPESAFKTEWHESDAQPSRSSRQSQPEKVFKTERHGSETQPSTCRRQRSPKAPADRLRRAYMLMFVPVAHVTAAVPRACRAVVAAGAVVATAVSVHRLRTPAGAAEPILCMDVTV
jgi:hypothetical protein